MPPPALGNGSFLQQGTKKAIQFSLHQQFAAISSRIYRRKKALQNRDKVCHGGGVIFLCHQLVREELFQRSPARCLPLGKGAQVKDNTFIHTVTGKSSVKPTAADKGIFPLLPKQFPLVQV